MVRIKYLLIVLTIVVSVSSCKKEKGGCMDIRSLNYDEEATIDDGTCFDYLTDQEL